MWVPAFPDTRALTEAQVQLNLVRGECHLAQISRVLIRPVHLTRLSRLQEICFSRFPGQFLFIFAKADAKCTRRALFVNPAY